jgi:aspartyl-tRNA(Asn)/glutamyl-tRNA(Gln) amidotransferase subunit C
MALTRAEMDHLALLARIGLTDDEKDRMANQLGDILQHMERLNQLDTEHIPPTAQIIEAENVLRDDAPRPSLPHDKALANAPRAEEPFVRVLPILE